MRRWLAILATSAVLAAGCTGGEDTATTSTSAEVTTTLAPRVETTTTLAAAPPVTTTTVLPEPGSASADCVVGEWELNSARFVETLSEAFASSFPGVSVEHAGGTFITTLDSDGSMSSVREEWTMAIATPEGTLYQSISSRDSGTYVIDEEAARISIALDPGSEQTVSMQVEVDGVLQDVPLGSGTFQLPAEASNPSGVFTCSDEQLVVTTADGVVSEFSRL